MIFQHTRILMIFKLNETVEDHTLMFVWGLCVDTSSYNFQHLREIKNSLREAYYTCVYVYYNSYNLYYIRTGFVLNLVSRRINCKPVQFILRLPPTSMMFVFHQLLRVVDTIYLPSLVFLYYGYTSTHQCEIDYFNYCILLKSRNYYE